MATVMYKNDVLNSKAELKDSGKRIVDALNAKQEQIWQELLDCHKAWVDRLTNNPFIGKKLLSIAHKFKKTLMLSNIQDSERKVNKLKKNILIIQDLYQAVKVYATLKDKPAADKLFLDLPEDEPLVSLRKAMESVSGELCTIIFKCVLGSSVHVKEAKAANRMKGMFPFPGSTFQARGLMKREEIEDCVMREIENISQDISITENEKSVCLGSVGRALVPIKAKYKNPLSTKQLNYLINPLHKTDQWSTAGYFTLKLPSVHQLKESFRKGVPKRGHPNLRLMYVISKAQKVLLPTDVSFFYKFAKQQFYRIDPDYTNVTRFTDRLPLEEIRQHQRKKVKKVKNEMGRGLLPETDIPECLG